MPLLFLIDKGSIRDTVRISSLTKHMFANEDVPDDCWTKTWELVHSQFRELPHGRSFHACLVGSGKVVVMKLCGGYIDQVVAHP